MRPKYSIFIPAFNADIHLENFCNNILRQNEKPDEVMIVDDTENSIFFFKSIQNFFREKKIELNFLFIKNDKNLKPSKCWNKNYHLFKNNIIFRMDVDDFWFPNHTSDMINEYLKNDKYVVYSQKNSPNFILRYFYNNDFIFTNQALHSSVMFNISNVKIIYPITDLPYDDLMLYIKLKYIQKKKILLTNLQTCSINTKAVNRWSSRGDEVYKKKKEKIFYLLALKKKFYLKKITFKVFFKILKEYNFFQAIYIFYKMIR